MSVISGSGEFGRELVKALGLEGKKVRSITLRSAVEEAVTVDVEMLVIDREAMEVATLLKRYKLVDVDAGARAERIAEVLSEIQPAIHPDAWNALLDILNRNADRL